MSDLVDKAVAILNEKVAGNPFDGRARFVFKGEGSLLLDAGGARPDTGGDEAEVTLSARAETFRAILEGELNPTAAFMTGRLSIDGNMGMALRLASLLG
ncbi:MAG: SCP2 sterol-binding domain-containing protein [Rubellimicrobium sp.]|nr:SCP2 sterol-binding domain-containing protein [Rubellimicrobium sp.]